jgi:hypothetical protein
MPISFLNTNNGGRFSAISPPYYTIGQAALGGVIAYLLQSGDPGYDPYAQHGLVATPSDYGGGALRQWGNDGVFINVSTGTAIGTGLANSNAIVSASGTGNYAARLARTDTTGGFTDWYLPSKDELNQLYINRAAVGGLRTDGQRYWSSSQVAFNVAWAQDMANSAQAGINKNGSLGLRFVRSF